VNRTLALALAVALLPAAAAAQQRPRRTPRANPQAAAPAPVPDSTRPGPMGRRMGMGMESGGLAGWLAANPAGLDLTADQLTRIRAARDEMVQANAPLREQLRSRVANRDWRSMAPADRQALMDSTRAIREQMRANGDRARTAVTGILTPAQQQTLDRLRPNWRTGGPGPAMRGRPGGRMAGPPGMAMGGRWMRPFAMRGAWLGVRAGPAWWSAARLCAAVGRGYRIGWNARMLARVRVARFARGRAALRAWRLERGRPWI